MTHEHCILSNAVGKIVVGVLIDEAYPVVAPPIAEYGAAWHTIAYKASTSLSAWSFN